MDTMTPKLSEAQIDRVWKGMLSSEIRAYYFAELAQRYGAQQRYVTWAMLVFSSGAFASLILELPAYLHSIRILLSLGAAALSAFSLVQQNQKRATDAADVHFRWNKLFHDYEVLWDNVYSDEAAKKLESLTDRAAEISKASTAFPDDKRALLRWQDHVESHHGLHVQTT